MLFSFDFNQICIDCIYARVQYNEPYTRSNIVLRVICSKYNYLND